MGGSALVRGRDLCYAFTYSQWMNSGKPSNAAIQQLLDDYQGSPALAVYSTHKITVDGTPVSLTAYNINGNNYCKLRDLGKVLGFHVGWDDASHTVSILTDQPYSE